MGFSKDGLPLLGAIPGYEATLLAAGFTGHGFGFAWLSGYSVAQLINEGQNTFCSSMSTRRFFEFNFGMDLKIAICTYPEEKPCLAIYLVVLSPVKAIQT